VAGDLDFTADLSGVDRDSLLRDAIWRVDALERHLDGDQASAQLGPAGVLLRSIQEDVAEFGAYPIVYPIAAEDFVQRDGVVPQGFDRLGRTNRFVRIEFPINLFPRSEWSFDRLEVRVEFNPAGEPSTRPKAFDIFPNQQLVKLAEWKYGVSVSLDSELRLSATVPPPVPAAAGANLAAKTGGSIAIGPFDYSLKRMAIETTMPGLERVFWRLDGDHFLQNDSPRFIVIAQIPRQTSEVVAAGALQAYRNYDFLTARVKNTFRELPRAIRTFFQHGAPISHEVAYDLTSSCKDG